jgi:hypothetical protein
MKMAPRGAIFTNMELISIAVTNSNAAMVTPDSVAIPAMMALARFVAIPVTGMIPVAVAVTIFAAVAIADPHANTIFADADANLCGRRQSHRQDCGAYQTENEFFHSNLLRVAVSH